MIRATVSLTIILALAAAGLVLSPATSPLLAAPETAVTAAPEEAADAQEKTSQSPQGVSPADPSIEQPRMDEWVCSKCGATNVCPKPGYGKRKGYYGGPMLAPGAEGARCAKGAKGHRARAARPGRGCGMKGQGLHRGHGMCDGHGRKGRGRGMMGHNKGVAAERMLKHATELELTDDQIGKLEMLAYETKKQVIGLHADIEREQLEVQKQMRSGSDDSTQIKRHLSAISKARLGIQEAKIDNLFKARKILTKEQKAMVKENHPRLGRILD